MKDNIYVFGHRNPDTDSVTSAIALSYLKGVVYGCFCPIEIRSKIDVKDLIIDEYIRTE